MSPVFTCSDTGALYYRGTLHDRGLFERLRALFAAEPWPHEREYVAQIDAALRKYDAIHAEEKAA